MPPTGDSAPVAHANSNAIPTKTKCYIADLVYYPNLVASFVQMMAVIDNGR